MADRTDIDALLIGALYGELTPADEARLAAHLESHPADRSALDGLGQTRTRVRDHGLLTELAEPPQSISARLLQEAARSAPKVSDRASAGWFQRLARTLLAHPAMATAAMFVLVVGVAGALYARHGERLAVSTESVASGQLVRQGEPTTAPSSAAAPSPAVPPPSAPAPGAAAESETAGPAPERAVVASAPPAEPPRPAAVATPMPSKPLAKSAKGGGVSGIELRPPPPPTVKDLDDTTSNYYVVKRDQPAKAAKAAKLDADDAVGDLRVQALDKASPSGGAGVASPRFAQPLPVAPAASAVAAAPPSDGNATQAWAQNQYDRVIALVKANQCEAAASAATEIYARDPAFYAARIDGDRAVKPCQPYLSSARALEDRKRAKAVRAPAAGSRGSDEPVPARRP